MALTKTVNNATPNVGATITFTVTLTDLGPGQATNVQVTDLLPAGLTLVGTGTPSQGSYNTTTGLWTVGTVTTAASPTLQLQATVVSPNAQTNTATISHKDQFDPNTANNTASATETPQQADLSVSKTVSNPTPNVGDNITYTITVTNNGPNSASNVTVHDALPTGVTFVSANPSAAYNSSTGVWTVGTVNVGTPQTLIITAKVFSASPAANTASITHADQFDPDTANNTDTASTTPQQADLAVNKTVSNATPNVGDTVTFTVTLTDNGPSNATNVQVTDLLPFGLTYVSSTPSQGTYAPATGLWTVGSVSNRAQATLVLQAQVANADSHTNTATISHADQTDPTSGNNSGSATVTPQRADLALTKTVSNATPNVGDTISFTVTLTDLGPNTATNVTATDLLPSGLTYVSSTPSAGTTYNSTTGLWTVGTVTTTTPKTLVLNALVATADSRTNTATTTHADQFDPNAANNTASATETPQKADLTVSKTVNNAQPNVGDTITFTIVVTNNGPNTATNVTVNESLPPGLSFVSASTGTGSYNNGTGVWTIGTMFRDAAAALTVSAKVVSPNAQTDTASIKHSDQFDPNTGNNSASATETPAQADLALTKAVISATPDVGDTVTFTVTLTDKGPDPATNVEVNDLLPAGLSFVSATPSQGAYDSVSGAWVVGTVTTTTPQTLQIMARVVSPNAQTNTATIGQADQFDPVTTNNSASATETPQQADLALTKSVDDAIPNVGDVISFTVTLTNKGPNTATNVQVADLLPVGLFFVGAVPSQGPMTARPASG